MDGLVSRIEVCPRQQSWHMCAERLLAGVCASDTMDSMITSICAERGALHVVDAVVLFAATGGGGGAGGGEKYVTRP